MKKLSSLILAVVSTTFIFVGATQAAEKFDRLALAATPAAPDTREYLSAPPCAGPGDPEDET